MSKYLPLHTNDVIRGIPASKILELEKRFGNGDLSRAIEYARLAGPFKVTSPWELEDPDGLSRINASGYAAIPFGERYPPLLDFIRQYLDQSPVMGLPQQSLGEWRAVLEHNLVKLLTSVAPSHADSQVFFSNSGAEAVESAIKFAKAWRPDGKYFVNFQRAYHGKTLGAMSLTPNEEIQGLFHPLALDTLTLPFGDLAAFEETIYHKGSDNITAVILEPIQGEAGVIIPPQDFLSGLDRITKRLGIPVIVDEIQAGLGRSGYWFPSIEWGGMDPDIITLAKPLGGGMVPVGATIARKEIYKNMLGGLACKRHSNTFGGNSLTMAIAVKSLEILDEENLVERSRTLGEKGLIRLEEIAQKYPGLISEVRGFGLWYAIEFQPVIPSRVSFGHEDLVGEFTSMLGLMTLHAAGVHANLSMNCHRTIRLTPALNIPDKLFDEMFDRVEAAAKRLHKASVMLIKTPPKSLLDLTRLAFDL